MAKLPKKSTMLQTIDRVIGYANKLEQAGHMSTKRRDEVIKPLLYLKFSVLKAKQ